VAEGLKVSDVSSDGPHKDQRVWLFVDPGMKTPQDRTLAEQLSRAFGVFAGLVAVGFGVTALGYLVSWVWLTPEYKRSRLAVNAESAAYSAMLDQETGLRGYASTHEAHFLEPYTRGQAVLARANMALSAFVATRPELGVAMLGTRLAEERWHERWAKPVAESQLPAAAALMLEGKLLFDAYRGEQAVFAAGLERHAEALASREQLVIAVRVSVDIAVFMLLFLFAVRQHRALRDGIVAPVAAMLRHVRHIRDGQLEATVDHAGPHELAELAEGLNEMVRALAAARAFASSRDEALRSHSSRLRRILEASREFSESLNLRYVVGAVRQSTAAVGGYDLVVVWLMDDAQKRLIASNGNLTSRASYSEAPPRAENALATRAAKSGRVTFEGPSGEVRFNDADSEPVRAIAIPLIVGARVVGALEARHTESRVATREVVEVLEMLATHAATAIESARLHELIEERSQMDALTRLFNRRRLEEDLDAECKRSARYGRPLAFVMLDVDNFKLFNDTHGHPQADTALQEVAQVIAGSVRTTDTAYRYGGEEFCVLMRETGAQEAMQFAERLRHRIEQRFASGATMGITASFGVADFMPDAPTARALVEAADAAMYESKHAGRNRVALSSRPRPGPMPDTNDTLPDPAT
jgi:diguanylate cyclase (GGDEF)-like protein